MAFLSSIAACSSSDKAGGSDAANGSGNSAKGTIKAREADTTTTSSPAMVTATTFVKGINAANVGLKVTQFSNSVLGSEDSELQSLRSGSIQFAVMSSGTVSEADKQIGIFNAPFLFTNVDDLKKYADSTAGHALLAGLDQVGLHALGWGLPGFSDVMSKKPIRTLADFKGVKTRIIAGAAEETTLKGLGAVPVSMPSSQIYLALSQGAIDATTGAPAMYVSNKLDEVAKYMVQLQYEPIIDIILVNKHFWDSLNPSQQAAIQKSADTASAEAFNIVQQYTDKSVAALKAGGVNVTDNVTDLPQIVQKMKTDVYPKFEASLGGTVLQDALSALGK